MLYAVATAAGLAIGVLVGLLAGVLWATRRARASAEASRAQSEAFREEIARSQAKLEAADAREATLGSQLAAARQETEAWRSQAQDAKSEAARLETRLAAGHENLAEQRRLLADAETKLRDVFASAGAEALSKNNEQFLELARSRFDLLAKTAEADLGKKQEQIEASVGPLNRMLDVYSKRLAEIEEARAKSYTEINLQLGQVVETHRTLGTTTQQLVTALSNPGNRGQWGEIGLRRVLELAGMTRHCDFEEQVSVSSADADGSAGRPDAVVRLPDDRCIVIDSKYPLTDFFAAMESEDPVRRAEHLKKFANAVRGHATTLSRREYWNKFANSPEFVVMFMPGEALIYAAVQQDRGLIEEMFEKKVIVATPTTLLALLKTAAAGWRQAEVENNVEEVRKIGVEIAERLGKFAGEFQKVGTQLESATRSYNSAVGSLEGRLLVSARRMADLGVRGPRDLPEVAPVETTVRQLANGSAAGGSAGGG